MTLFDCSSSTEFLQLLFEHRSGRSGYKSEIAKVMGIQGPYLSQILKGTVGVNLEQGFRLSAHLNHSDLEREYFLAMIQKDRSGTRELEKHFEGRMQQLKQSHKQIRSRISNTSDLTIEQKNIYYSDWLYAAVHVGCGLKGMSSIEEIALKLKTSSLKVRRVIDFLLAAGLIEVGANGFKESDKALHLEGNSQLITQHHRNWRLLAMNEVQPSSEINMHFSACMTLDMKTYESVRAKILKLIEVSIAEMREATPEEVFVLNLDWFRLT